MVSRLYTRESRPSPLAGYLKGGSELVLLGTRDEAAQRGTGSMGLHRSEMLLTTMEEIDEMVTVDEDDTPSMIDLRPLKVNLFGHPRGLGLGEGKGKGGEGKGKGREGGVGDVQERVRGESGCERVGGDLCRVWARGLWTAAASKGWNWEVGS